MISARALIFDFDDTLAADEPAIRATLRATAVFAKTFFPALDTRVFANFITARATALWHEFPYRGEVARLGIHWTECLWLDFGDTGLAMDALREWSRTLPTQLFREAARAQGFSLSAADARKLTIYFRTQRWARQRNFPAATLVLARLKKHFPLAMLTNGDSIAQRSKISTSGLAKFFDSIIVSGEHNLGKPDPAVFELTAKSLGVVPSDCVMIGNSLTRDIAGAQAAGFASTIWMRVPGSEEFAATPVTPDHTISHLRQLIPLLLDK